MTERQRIPAPDPRSETFFLHESTEAFDFQIQAEPDESDPTRARELVRLKFHDPKDLKRLRRRAGIGSRRFSRLLSGRAQPTETELEAMAAALELGPGLKLRDFEGERDGD